MRRRIQLGNFPLREKWMNKRRTTYSPLLSIARKLLATLKLLHRSRFYLQLDV